MNGKNNAFKIRPAGRHILTIGRDLIKDKYAAIVELVKNAYDADSSEVRIIFEADSDNNGYSVVIKDNGHGMSRDTVINKWLVPSTEDKVNRRESPNGRIMQGSKGIGRYAASVLGNDLLLETIADGEVTRVYVDWSDFENSVFLEDVEVLVETDEADKPNGTYLEISGGKEYFEEWDEKQFDKLRFELKKLMPPEEEKVHTDQELSGTGSFDIFFKITNFSEKLDIEEYLKPYPLLNLFDYRISGKINSDGKGSLTYSQQKARNTVDENIEFDLGKPTDCGKLTFDIRVYDRESESLDALIGRGLKDEKNGNYLGKQQTKKLLNEYCGIGVYRNGFRIRPLGDPDFDWLRLNARRVQNPSKCIGNNQVIGYVLIESEAESNLIEKSARDGLKENNSFEKLKEITKEVINELEERRFSYRKKAGLSRSALKIEQELEKLFNYDNLKTGIRTKLKKQGIDNKSTENIIELIEEEEKGKNRIAENIRETVAIYQGQATLGKIINIVLHEGRSPLNAFKNQKANLEDRIKRFKNKRDPRIAENILEIAERYSVNVDKFVKLFERLDPLASGKRGPKRNFLVKKTIIDSFEIFEKQLKENDICFNVSGSDDLEFFGWYQDFFTIFTNLIDNSIYWITHKSVPEKKITVSIANNKGELQYIDYKDSGPGIEGFLIDSGAIFEPEFSTKPEGTGLGLALAGEASDRNNLDLKAFESPEGAYFRLQIREGEENENN